MTRVTTLSKEFIRYEDYLLIKHKSKAGAIIYRRSGTLSAEGRVVGSGVDWKDYPLGLSQLRMGLWEDDWEGYFFPSEELGTEIMIHTKADL